MLLLMLSACTNDNDKLLDPQDEAVLQVKEMVQTDLSAMHDATEALCAAAPTTATWGAAEAEPARTEWKQVRNSYERVEGAIAVLFPDLDAATDERYDGFLGAGPDDYLFDGEGVIGVHGIERILWADSHPAEVVAFERGLPGYVPAAFPANQQESDDFRNSLCARLTTDTGTMESEFAPLALDGAAAFRGVIGSMMEQIEKVNLAYSGEDESRYAQYTLADMRANLAGGRDIYSAFGPWLESVEGGSAVHTDIEAGFDRVAAAYASLEGDGIPTVPSTWNPDDPSDIDLGSDYGKLWLLLSAETDPEQPGALVERMVAAADLLGIPQLAE
jgi:iron uptake system component EfeO